MTAPLVPSGCDLRAYPFMPLEIERLRKSKAWLLSRQQPEIGFYSLNLWMASWHEVPAASLEDDDIVLADRAQCSLKRWPKVKEIVLRGWVKCDDGLLYHPVVAEKALDVWGKRRGESGRGAAGAAAKWGTPTGASAKRSERLSAARGKGKHTPDQWAALIDFCGGRCVRCGEENGTIVKDHITPIYQGGSDGIDNIQPLCRRCNSSKGPEAVDHRPNGWEDACKTPAQAGIQTPRTPAERLVMSGNREREEDKKPSLSGGQKTDESSLLPRAKSAARKHGIPPDWVPSMDGRRYANERAQWQTARIDAEVEHFRDHHRQKGQLFADIDAAWRTWVMNGQKFDTRSGSGARQPQTRTSTAYQDPPDGYDGATMGHLYGPGRA